MATQVIADQAVVLQLRAVHLCFPAQVAAEQAVHEDDGAAVRIAGFLHGELHAIWRGEGIAGGHGRRQQRHAGEQP